MAKVSEGVHKVIKTVASPLRFFALAAGLLCTVVIVLAWKSTLPPDITLLLIKIAFFLFIGLIVLVAILVVFFPKKLTFDQEAHLTVMRERLGDSELPSTYDPGALPNVTAPTLISGDRSDKS